MNKRTFRIMMAALIVMTMVLAVSGAVVVATADTPPTLIDYVKDFAPAIGMGLYGTFMWIQRRMAAGEAFSPAKIATTLGIGLVASVGLYFTGTTAVTGDMIGAALGEYAPLGMIGFYGLILGYIDQYLKNHGGAHAITDLLNGIATQPATPATTSPATPKPASSNPVNLPDGGCDVLPSIGGKTFHLIYGLTSPVTISFAISATQPTSDHSGYTSVDIDWDDGTVQNVPLSLGKAAIDHTFTFIPIEHYYGKTFNPVFTFNENTGEKFILNKERTMIEIGVEIP